MTTKIDIIKNAGTTVEEDSSVMTDSYILAYMDHGKVKIDGNLDIRSFSFMVPELMKVLADKWQSGSSHE